LWEKSRGLVTMSLWVRDRVWVENPGPRIRTRGTQSLGSETVIARILVGLVMGCAVGTCWGAERVSVEALRAGIMHAQAVVAACKADAAACDAKSVGGDVEVGEPGKNGGYAVHWGWLRDALTTAHDSKKPEERAAAMQAAATKLAEMSAEVGAGSGDVGAARRKVDAILARDEFVEVKGSTWWQRQVARFWDFVTRVFTGLAQAGEAVPWLLTALEWALFVGALAGLLIFLFRSFARQRLQVALGDAAAVTTAWDRESEDWAKLAEASALAGDWREAVHGLYWAAIVHLEARRAWRHNPARTPREYVRLLRPGSAQQASLRGLTQIFERVWYGFEDVSGAEYARAREMFEGLSRGRGADDIGLAQGESA